MTPGVYCTKKVWPSYPTAYPPTCQRKAVKHGLCAYHQLEAIKAREAKRDAKRNEQHARFRYNSDVHEARQRVVEEAMKAHGVFTLPITLAVACRRLAKLLKKGPTA
jgi:hypothetical protein